MEEVEMMKKIIKNSLKFIIFITFTILPFLTVTQLIGMETFLDSFENSEYYLCLQNDGFFASKINNENHIIIIKSSHPNFRIKNGDSIIYWNNDGDILCNKLERLDDVGSLKRYKSINYKDEEQLPIYENQIIGRVINTVDNNIWFSISLKIWDISIQNLNFNSFLTND
jgi:hypothetical protein